MIKRIKRNVPYNKPLIVASIIADKLGDNPETAVVTPVISIGFNGTEFVSSTEWLYQNNGVECIYSFNLEPQGATFITLEAGMNFAIDDRKRWSMLRDKKTAFVEALGQNLNLPKASRCALPCGWDAKNSRCRTATSNCWKRTNAGFTACCLIQIRPLGNI